MISKSSFVLREKRKINIGDYKTLNAVCKAPATKDLKELVEKFKIHKWFGSVGAGKNYVSIGS